jgi:AhpD family alkylhydroperoxidase
MANLPSVEMKHAPAEVRAIYASALRGDLHVLPDLLAHRPELLPLLLSCYGTVGRTLERRTYEIVYLRISILNQCHACVEAHKQSSQWEGLTPSHWEALAVGDDRLFDRREKAALQFAEKLTCGEEAAAADLADLRKHFTAEQIVDLQLLGLLAKQASGLTDPLEADLKGPKARFRP